MNLDYLISAASWLYEDSPAAHVIAERSAIAVCGDGALEDALYEALFTTAYKPGVTIDLVRVSSDPDARGDAFLSRNAEALEFFARNQTSDSNLPRPIAIYFMDAATFRWDDFSFAYVIAPAGTCDTAGDARRVWLEEIPLLSSEGETWSPRDEARLRVLRAARRVHTAYTMDWNERYRGRDIDQNLYGGLKEGDDYALRSSLRAAVSIPWKMEIGRAHDAEELYQALKGDPSIREHLIWNEHRSWQAFMTLDGWRMPSEEELQAYIYQNGNDYRNKSKKLHPCLCDMEDDDWFLERAKELRKLRKSAWNAACAGQLDAFCHLDRISLVVHHRCKEMVQSESYALDMEKRFHAVEDALISARTARTDVHFEHLRSMERLFQRLKNNEANSYSPFEQACHAFRQALEVESSVDLTAVEAAVHAVWQGAQVAVERNKYRDFRQIDAQIIDMLPWIVDDARIDTIWKLYSKDNLFENIITAMLLRPKRIVFAANGSIPEEQLKIYRTLLERRGLNEIQMETIPLSELRLEEEDVETSVVDVSEAGDAQHSVVIPSGMRVIFYENGMLQDKAGAPGCARYIRNRISLTVDDIILMQGYRVLSMDDENEILGMEDDYAAFWEFARYQKAAGSWRTMIGILNGAESGIRRPVYRKTGADSLHISRTLTEDNYRALIENGGLRTLYDLQRRNAISGLLPDPDEHRISMDVFPDRHSGAADPYAASLETIQYILSGAADSQFTIDGEYARMTEPVLVYDLSQPLEVSADDARRLTPLVREGFLVSRGEGGRCAYRSVAIRHGLRKEGFALEAYVYYTLFLSGRFDDVRSNVRIMTGLSTSGLTLEEEYDVLATSNGRMGLISCKDTPNVDPMHIPRLVQQARALGTQTKPILVCSGDKNMDASIRQMCALLGVELIGVEALKQDGRSRNYLVNQIRRAMG